MGQSSFAASVFLLSLFTSNLLYCNPLQHQVVSGSAIVSTEGATLTVEASHQAILEWNSFSIQQGERTQFILPQTTSAILNRVVGGGLSEIHGRLDSNGAVYLINPNGIFVGPEGLIQTGAFLASTLDCSNEAFLQGEDLCFVETVHRGNIDNQGRISAMLGDIILLARGVENSGTMEAAQGCIAMGAGQEIRYRPYGDERIQIVLHTIETPVEECGIGQRGSLFARSAELKADGNLYAYAIQSEGLIDAVEQVLIAEEGFVAHSGKIYGEEVRVLGKFIHLEQEAEIDVSGIGGGGIALIGGDYQGQAGTLRATATVVDKEVKIYADALESGDGGKVIVWSDEATGFYGQIFARGGAEGGDGGFVEVSSQGEFDFAGFANTMAEKGLTGTLLLDPTDITISSAATDAGITFGAGCGALTYCNTGALSPRNINDAAILGNLATGNVTIASTPGGPGGSAGNITFTTAFLWTGANTNTFTLNARNNITFSAGFTNSTTAGNFVCNAALGAAGVLSIASGVTVSHSSAGNIQLISNATAGADMTITGALSVTGGNLTMTVVDDFTLTAGTGSILFNSAGNTFNFSSTAAAGSVATFDGPVTITNGNVTWTTAGTGTLTINNVFSTAGTGTISITTATGALATGAASTITHGSSGIFTFQSTGAGATIGNGFTQSATGGNASILGGTTVALTGAIANNSTSGSSLTITSGTTLISNATATITTAAAAGALSLTAGTTGTFGAAITHNSTAGNFTCNANTSLNFNASVSNNSSTGTTSVNAGLTASGVLTIAGGTTFSHISSGNIDLISNVTAGSDITITGALSVTGANLTMTVVDDFTLTAGTGSILYNASGKTFTFSSTSAAGSVAAFSGPVTITNGNVTWTTAGTGTLTINDVFSTAGSGTISVTTATGALVTGASSTITHASTGTFTFQSTGAAVTLGTGLTQTATGGDVSVSSGTTFAINGAIANNSTSGKTLTLTSGTTMTANASGSITTAATAGALLMTIGTTGTFPAAITHNSTAGNFTCNANTSITFNANVANNSLTGMTLVNSGLVNNGTLTIGPVGGGTTFIHSSTGDCSLISNPGAGSDITMNSPLTVTNANLIMTINDDCTMNATSGINWSAPGKTFTLHTTAASGTSVTLNAAVIADSTVSFQIDGGTLAINDNFTTSGTGTASFTSSGSITCGAASIFMHNSTGDLSFTTTGAGGDITFNGSTTVPSSNLTIFPDDDFTLGGGGTISFSAAGKLLSFETGTSTTHTFTGAVNVTGGNMTVDANDDITISAGTGSITYNVPGGTLSFLSTGGADPDFVLNGTLDVQNGTLMIATFDDIIFAAGSTFTYASPDTMTFDANGTTGAINWSGTANVSNGTLTMTAQTDITFPAAGMTTYTSPFPWNLTATTGLIDVNGTIDLTTAAAWNATCGTLFSIQGLVRNFSTGNLIISAGGDGIIGANDNGTPAQIGSAGGLTQMAIGGNLFILSSQTTVGATAFIGFSSGGQTGSISISVAGSANIVAGRNEDAAIVSPGMLTLSAAGDTSFSTDTLAGQIGRAYLQSADTLSVTTRNFTLTGFPGGGAAFIEAQGGKATVIANVTGTLMNNSFIRNTGSGNLNIVVDQQAPFPPQVGNGEFNLSDNASLSTNGGDLSLFTVSPSQNSVMGTINGANLSQGHHVFGVYYSLSGIDPPPFTIFYKGGGLSDTAFVRLNVAVAEVLQTGFERAMGLDFTGMFWPSYLFADDFTQIFFLYRKPFEYPLNMAPLTEEEIRRRWGI